MPASCRPRLSPVLVCCITAALSACGGGSGGDPAGDRPVPPAPQPVAQQYPGGVWEGSVGAGIDERALIGFIDGGEDGKGGEFYFARGAVDVVGYDALYGLLRTSGATVLATGVTYFSVRDGRYASGLTLRGTASSSAATGRTAAISGSYTSPAGTAAATGNAVPFRLTYSPLNDYPARADLLAGTYRGGAGIFAPQWVLTVSAKGILSGRVNGCTVQGTILPRSQPSPLYSVTMNFASDETACNYRGMQQLGVALLRFDAQGVSNSIWVFARSSAGPANTVVLNGYADARLPAGATPAPAPSPAPAPTPAPSPFPFQPLSPSPFPIS